MNGSLKCHGRVRLGWGDSSPFCMVVVPSSSDTSLDALFCSPAPFCLDIDDILHHNECLELLGVEPDVYGTLFFVCRDIVPDVVLDWLVGIQIPEGIPMDGSYVCLMFGAGILGLVIFLYSFFRSMLKHFDKLKVFLPFLVGLLACGAAENSFSSATGLSVIFWFLFINADNLYGKKNVIRTLSVTK